MPGLGVIAGSVRRLAAGVKLPQMQWNRSTSSTPATRCSPGSTSGRGSTSSTPCTPCPTDPGVVVATCDYGGVVNAAFRLGNVFATQFHPEKSANAGRRCSATSSRLLGRVTGLTTPELYPAIDLRGGRVVRLREGDFADETVYGDDPAAVATSFCEQGARWIHVVDLDAARTGEPSNRAVVGRSSAP